MDNPKTQQHWLQDTERRQLRMDNTETQQHWLQDTEQRQTK